jgi:hypothetical protein
MARKAAAGKKKDGENAPSVTQQPPPAFATAFTIAEFCTAHRISQTTYFDLKLRGLGPSEMELGRRRVISFEAAARWRKAREAVAEAAE